MVIHVPLLLQAVARSLKKPALVTRVVESVLSEHSDRLDQRNIVSLA